MEQSDSKGSIQVSKSMDIIHVDSTAMLVGTNAKKSSGFMSGVNLANTIVGGGILSLPFALSQSGLGFGLFTIILCAFLTDVSIMILVKCGTLIKKYTYQEVAKEGLGKVGQILLSICHFLSPIMSCMSYGIAISDNISAFTKFYAPNASILQQPSFILFIIILVIVGPLCMLRQISVFDKISSVSLLFVLFYSGVIFIKTIMMKNYIYFLPDTFDIVRPGIPQALAILSFAFNCQISVFPVYRTMKDNRVSNFAKVTHVTIGLTLVLYVFFSLFGYFTFSGMPTGNIFISYCNGDKLINATRIIFALTIMMTYPLQIFAAREVIQITFFSRYSFTWIRHIAITIVLLIVCYLVPSFIRKFDFILSLTGSLTAAPLAFIFPPLIYLRLKKYTLVPITCEKLVCYLILIFGFAVMIIGAAMSIKDLIVSDYVQVDQFWCYNNDGTSIY